MKYVNNIRKKRLTNLIYYMLSFCSCLLEQCINIRLCSLTHFSPVSRFLETYHLFCRLKQMTGFCIKRSIGLKWVKMMVLSVMRNRNIRDGKRKTIEESIFKLIPSYLKLALLRKVTEFIFQVKCGGDMFFKTWLLKMGSAEVDEMKTVHRGWNLM